MSGDTASAALLKGSLQKIKKGMLIVVGFSFFINLLLLSAPVYMLQVYDRVLSSRSTDTLLFLSLIIAMALLTLALLEGVRSAIVSRLGVWLDEKLGETIFAQNIYQPLRTRENPNTQGLRDLGMCRSWLSGPELFCFLDAPWAPMFLLIVFMLHPLLGFLATCGALILFSLAVANEVLTRPKMMAANKVSIQAMQQAESSVRNGDVVEAMGMMPNILHRWSLLNNQAVALQNAANFRNSTITSISRFVRQLLQIAMLGIGAWLVIAGQLSPGAMIAGSILMSRALSPVEQAISSWRSALAARDAYQRLRDSIKDAPQRPASMKMPAPKGNLSVEAVTYIHPGHTEPVLKNISFTVPAGMAIGVIGPSGAGKTTLIRMLLGNLKPRLGHVRLDGMDVSLWNSDDLGQYCGYLPQDIELFRGTISDNIARLGEIDAEKVVAAAQLAGCHELILKMLAGYDTQVGEGGLSLSGGERQRIALARALYGNPQYVVLDEPNASLDALGEGALLDAIRHIKSAGVTLIVIGHRPGIIQHVDNLLVLNNGQVQEFGPKETVLATLSGNAPGKSSKHDNTQINRDA